MVDYRADERRFYVSISVRGTPRERYDKWRPATEEEVDLALSRIGDAARAECIAASITHTGDPNSRAKYTFGSQLKLLGNPPPVDYSAYQAVLQQTWDEYIKSLAPFNPKRGQK